MAAEANATETGKRVGWRCVAERDGDASIELNLADWTRCKLQVVEVSKNGVRFLLHDDRPALTVGTQVAHATLLVMGLRVVGSLVVAHVTPRRKASTMCGAEFYPSTDADKRTMAILFGALVERYPRPK